MSKVFHLLAVFAVSGLLAACASDGDMAMSGGSDKNMAKKSDGMSSDKMVKKTAKKKKKAGPPRTKHFLVFFDLESAAIKGKEAKTVASAAKFAKANKGSNVYITGHTDRSGSKKYNMALAKKRVGAVVKGLTGGGLKKKSLGSVVQGENDPAVGSRDGKQDARNRRVVISIIY